jgi:SlyX protein
MVFTMPPALQQTMVWHRAPEQRLSSETAARSAMATSPAWPICLASGGGHVLQISARHSTIDRIVDRCNTGRLCPGAAEPTSRAPDDPPARSRTAEAVRLVFRSNTGMNQAHDTDARLTELEIKASYAEDLLDQLNQTIFRQQQQIDRLLHEVAELRRQQPEGGQVVQRNLRDELPPHY